MDAKEQEKRQKLAREQSKADLEWLLSQAQARRVMKKFFRVCDTRPFTTDPVVTAYNLGRKELAEEFLRDLRSASLDKFLVAQREHLEDTHV